MKNSSSKFYLFRSLTSTGQFLLITVLLMTFAPLSNVEAKKPIHAEPGDVVLVGDILAADVLGDPVGTFDVVIRSGQETTVDIVVRHFVFTALFAQEVNFFDNKYKDPDGADCFGGTVTASGKYTLFEDGSAVFQTFSEFLTADGEAIQTYEFYLSGDHDFDLANEEFPAEAPITVSLDFDRVEITTEGGGQNRRRSCTGVFDGDDFSATGIFSR